MTYRSKDKPIQGYLKYLPSFGLPWILIWSKPDSQRCIPIHFYESICLELNKTVQEPLSVRFENLQITASMHIRPQEYNQFEQDIFR